MSKAPDADLHAAPSYPRVRKDYIDLVHEIIRDEQPRAPGRTSRLLPFIVPLADMKYRGFGLKAMHKAANRAGIAVGYSSFVAWATRHLGTDSGKGSRAEAIVRKAVDDGAYESPGLVKRGEQSHPYTGAEDASTAETAGAEGGDTSCLTSIEDSRARRAGAEEVAGNTCRSTSRGRKKGVSQDNTGTSTSAHQAVSRARNESADQDSAGTIPGAEPAVSRARNESAIQDSSGTSSGAEPAVSRARNESEDQDSAGTIPGAEPAVSRARNESEDQDRTDVIPGAEPAVSRARNESVVNDNSSPAQASAPGSETHSPKEILQRRLDILNAASQKLKSPLERSKERALTNP